MSPDKLKSQQELLTTTTLIVICFRNLFANDGWLVVVNSPNP
jgi:hypothetical protein